MTRRPLAFFCCSSALSCALVAAAACGTTDAPNPFAPETGGTSAGSGASGGSSEGGGGSATASDAGADADPTLGKPCLDDEQCDDGIDCTFDACDDELDRCRHTPDDAKCQNGVYCDGLERCDPKLGCGFGEPMGCSDTSSCTIDACDEATQTCLHEPRDADGDGDPDVHCGGGDCIDTDPTVSSLQKEVCANAKDDDCDVEIDEAGCDTPQHDTCSDALEIGQPGSYAMSTIGATFDYATTCGLPNQASLRDVVAAVVLEAGPPVDVEVTARTPYPGVAVTLAGQCGDPATEIACGSPFPSPQGGLLAKLRARSIGDPDEALALPLYVTTDMPTDVKVDVAFLPPEPKPANETCGTAAPIVPGVPEKVTLVDAAKDVATFCPASVGDLVYELSLDEPSDIDVFATSLDGDGYPTISLRDEDCALPEDEITCQNGAAPHLFWHALPPGTYYVAVSATAPTTLLVTVELSGATPPPQDESCEGAPVLPHNETVDVALAGHQDDVATGCLFGSVDAAYTLDLPVASDVLLVERIAQGDLGAVELALPACASGADQLACGVGSWSPIRAALHDVSPGEYRVVAESVQAQPVKLTAFVRPAVPPVLVPFADGCADALQIPPEGGLFQGTTANAAADWNAGCDLGGQPQGGAPDQLLALELTETKRVVLDMSGSTFTTVLDVRKGPACPGKEVPLGCAVGYGVGRSYLDLTLGQGVYFIQIDGFDGQSGPWFLDVRVVDP